jgi:hypothetical protein
MVKALPVALEWDEPDALDRLLAAVIARAPAHG